MTHQDNELLDPRTWLEQVRRFLAGLSESKANPERHIRQAYHLARLAPDMISRSLPDPVAEEELEAMLADARYETAVRTVLGGEFAGRQDRNLPTLSAHCASDVRCLETDCLIDDRSFALLQAWAGSFIPPQARLS